jgi:hypothetical protein
MDGLEASLAVHSRLLLGPIAMNGSVIILSDFEPGYKYNEPNRTQLISNLLFHTELSHHPILFQVLLPSVTKITQIVLFTLRDPLERMIFIHRNFT